MAIFYDYIKGTTGDGSNITKIKFNEDIRRPSIYINDEDYGEIITTNQNIQTQTIPLLKVNVLNVGTIIATNLNTKNVTVPEDSVFTIEGQCISTITNFNVINQAKIKTLDLDTGTLKIGKTVENVFTETASISSDGVITVKSISI